jgi:hypothetical protein
MQTMQKIMTNTFTTNIYSGMAIAIIVVSTIVHMVYVYSTRFTKRITIQRAYTSIEDDPHSIHTTYHVVATSGHVYDVSNSIWLWSWGAADKWAALQKGKTYTVSGYGKYFSMVDMHPQITSVSGISV